MPTDADLTQSHQSVAAYDDAARVAAYDAKMEIMEKPALYRTLLPKLRAGGWFVNADILLASHVDIEARFQTLRQLGIQQRLREQTGEEKSLATIAAELDELEKQDGDQPLQLDIDLSLLRQAGFHAVDCFWKETREAVWGARCS